MVKSATNAGLRKTSARRVYGNGDAIPAGLTDSEWGNQWELHRFTARAASSAKTTVLTSMPATRRSPWRSMAACTIGTRWIDSRGLCPVGWHVPTDEEWMVSEMALGMSESEANSTGWRGTDEGTQLKSTYGWYDGGNGTDNFGFSALPGGLRYYDGVFLDAGDCGYWWSSSPSGGNAWFRSLYQRLSSHLPAQLRSAIRLLGQVS